MDWRAWPNWVKFGFVYSIVMYVFGIFLQVPIFGLIFYPLKPTLLNVIYRPLIPVLGSNFRVLYVLIGFIINLVLGFIGGLVVMTLTRKKENFKQHLILSFILLFALTNIANFYDAFFLTTLHESFEPLLITGLLPFSIAALIYFIYKIIKIRKTID